jgi:hypothetical protein
MRARALKMLTWGSLIFISGSAFAGVGPAMFTSCPQSRTLRSPPNGAGVYFSADCSVAYVLPPRLGEISISHPTATSTVGVCGMVKNVFEALDFQSRQTRRYIKQIESAESDIDFDGLQDPWQSGAHSGKPVENLNPQLEKLEELRAKVADSVLKILEWNEKLAGYEGPKVRLTVIADHNKLVEDYQALNPGLTLRPIPVAKSVLTFVGKVTSNIGKAPAALFMDMAGVKVPGSYFTGLKAEDEEGKGKENFPTLFASGVAGQLVLSLVGACPFYNVESGAFPERIESRGLTSYIAPAVDYIYNVQVNRSYEAKYNLSELLKRIQKQSTSGGFFSSKTLHSLVIDNSSTGWFTFRSLSEDPRHEWDTQLSQTLKAGIIARLLARLGAQPVGTAEVPGIIAPGKTGANAAAEGLGQCPHYYCQAAGFTLKVLSATIGGSAAVSEFIQSNNHWEIETVTESKMVPQMGQTGFGKE